MTTATTAMARTIIATAREDAVRILCDSVFTLHKVTDNNNKEADIILYRAIGALIFAMKEAEAKVEGF